jgi:hypothetical protein
VQAARVLNALAEPGDREYALARVVTDSPLARASRDRRFATTAR